MEKKTQRNEQYEEKRGKTFNYKWPIRLIYDQSITIN